MLFKPDFKSSVYHLEGKRTESDTISSMTLTKTSKQTVEVRTVHGAVHLRIPLSAEIGIFKVRDRYSGRCRSESGMN